MSWRLSPDEFAHVWRETDLDRVPYPLRILETPRTEDDAETLRAELTRRFPPGDDPDLSACLRILAEPRTRVVVVGTAGDRRLRALAGVVYDRAVLAVQEPGPDPEFAGAVRLAIGHTGKLGNRLAGLLPATPAGSRPARSADAAAVRDEETVVQPDRTAVAIQKMLRATHTAQGHIRIENRLDLPGPPPPVHYTWLDVDNDGRYLLRADDKVHIVPASPTQLAAHLQQRIAG